MNTSQNNYQQILQTNIYKLGATALACAPAKKTKQKNKTYVDRPGQGKNKNE